MAALTACDGPQSSLSPAGPAAETIAWLWWAMVLGFGLVFFAVVGLWIYALNRKPKNFTEDRAQGVAQRWIIGGGIILPALSITALLAAGIPAGHRMLPLPREGEDPLLVEIIGHQWWWEVRYPESAVVTANELYLPLNRPLHVKLTSNDVIHSFWVPTLSGKLDLMPGRTNVLRLEANKTGSYRGQCAEFCGNGHAHMVLNVEVLQAEQFSGWISARQQVPSVSESESTLAEIFVEHCGMCHRVGGISEGNIGPDLSAVGARKTIGGRPRRDHYEIGNNAIEHWLRTHKAFTPGGAAPDHSAINPPRIEALAAWLESLDG